MPPIHRSTGLLALLLAAPAAAWAAYHERRILRRGRPLTPDELAVASAAGVSAPQRIRILAVTAVPNPFGRTFRWLEARTSLCISDAEGLTLRYGIFAVPPADTDRHLLAHEFAHTRQYEECGTLFAFLHQYITQCLHHGYHHAPFEQVARSTANRIAPNTPPTTK